MCRVWLVWARLFRAEITHRKKNHLGAKKMLTAKFLSFRVPLSPRDRRKTNQPTKMKTEKQLSKKSALIRAIDLLDWRIGAANYAMNPDYVRGLVEKQDKLKAKLSAMESK